MKPKVEIDQNGLIYLGKAKTKMKREIPVNEDLAQVFKEIKTEQGLTSEYIFTYCGYLLAGLTEKNFGTKQSHSLKLFPL